MKTLTETLKERRLKIDDIKNLVKAVKDALSMSENLDLNFDNIGFDDDLRLTTINSSKEKMDISYEISKFLIKVLRFIDVNDKEALNLGYNLFVRSSKENYTINDLMEVCK